MNGPATRMRPTLSIGLPFWNSGRTIQAALRSILAQTFTDWELIAVDDASSDDSLAVVKSLSDPRLRVIQGEKRLGLAARLNQITILAQADVIARMDADDVCHPLRFAKQVQFLSENPEIDIVGTGLVSVDRQGAVVGVRIMPSSGTSPNGRPIAAHATLCFRKSWALANPYNESNRGSEDWELLMKSQPRIRNLIDHLYFYREFESFGLKKYLSRQYTTARTAWRLRRQVDSSNPLRVSAHAAAASLAHLAAALVGQTDRLIRRRSVPLEERERLALQAVYDAIVVG